MKKFIIICLLFALPSISYGADTHNRKNVEELLMLMNADSVLDNIYSQIDRIMQSMAQQIGVKPSEKELFDRYTAKMVALMRSEMSWSKMKGPMADLYLKHYTAKEINDMTAFYKSETGRSMVQKIPAVMKDSILISQDLMRNFIPKMQALTQELKDEVEIARSMQKHPAVE